MPSQTIQWFPGHMAKTRRLIRENLSRVDLVIELLDARIPHSSRNPEIQSITEGKPLLTLLNKADLSDPVCNARWVEFFAAQGENVCLTDCESGSGTAALPAAIQRCLQDKIRAYRQKGMAGRRLRAMIVGIPNVGKSSLINRLCGGRKTKVENRPGVTLQKQWIATDIGLDLMDMPGVLWPKFEEQRVGENLAFTGAIRDGILDVEELAMRLCLRLRSVAPSLFLARYKLSDDPDAARYDGYDLLGQIGKRRGMLLSGGETDFRRAALMLLDEFRSGRIGRISLELPPAPAEEENHA